MSGTWLVQNETGNGSTTAVSYVAGSPSSWASFAALTGSFTICSISRYTGPNFQRIIQGNNVNWLHGHWGYDSGGSGGHAGVSYYNGWIVPAGIQPGADITTRLGVSKYNWIYMCGSSGLSYLNGVNMGGGGSNPGIVNINRPGYGWPEYSDFGILELILWTRQLSEAEIVAVQAYQAQQLTAPPPPPPPPSSVVVNVTSVVPLARA